MPRAIKLAHRHSTTITSFSRPSIRPRARNGSPCLFSIASTAVFRRISLLARRRKSRKKRRLLYVAMTRAKDHLHLIVPQRFYSHQQHKLGSHHMYAARTRFIESSMLQFFTNVGWPPAIAPDETNPRMHKERIDIGIRIRARWQEFDRHYWSRLKKSLSQSVAV